MVHIEVDGSVRQEHVVNVTASNIDRVIEHAVLFIGIFLAGLIAHEKLFVQRRYR